MPKDKVAVVTGASRGIGRSISFALAGKGALIVAVDIDKAATDTVVSELQASGARALGIVGNVTSSEDVERIISATVENFGKLDILVNNAGITRDGLLVRMKDEEWDAVLSVNLKGAFLCSRGAVQDNVEATIRQDNKYCFHSWTDGKPRSGKLLCKQGRPDRSHQIKCP